MLLDFDLDALFVAITNALMTVVNNDRHNPLIARFLGDDRLSEIREPILAEQLCRSGQPRVTLMRDRDL